MADTGNRELAASLEGATYGGFHIVHRIATGGMGTVYLAFRVGLAGIVQPSALKIIHPHLALDQEFVEMFVDEARIASCIHHPSVCKVLDFGNDRGTYYLAMEYVLGETWAATLRALHQKGENKKIGPALLAYVVAQACEGLHAAHDATNAAGEPLLIVHRDVSPHNLFIGYDGSVRVLDFGIASAVDRLHTTRVGTVKGRFSYMSPEHMRGERVDRRSDVWSLGVMLREGLTGKSVFRRPTDAETITAVTQDPIPDLDDSVPLALREVLERSMQRDPELRYPTAREMGQALTSYLMSLDPSEKVGTAEASQWMSATFARNVEEKRSLLKSAGAGFATSASEVSRLSLYDITPGPIVVPEIGTDLVTATGARTPSESARPGSGQPPPLPRRHAKWLAVPLLVSLVASLGLGFWLGERGHADGQPSTSLSGRPAALATTRVDPRAEKPLARAPTDSAQRDGVLGPAGARDGEPEREPTIPEAAALAGTQASPSDETAKPRVSEPVNVRTGMVNVVCTDGWADVYLGARKLGSTPGRFVLPAGPQVLSLRALGTGPRQQEQVNVVAGGIARLRVTLQ